LLTINGLYAADQVVLTFDPSIFSLKAIDNLKITFYNIRRMAGHSINKITAVNCLKLAVFSPTVIEEERYMSHLQNVKQDNVVVFSLDEPRYALYLSTVVRVVRSVEVTPLPKAPEIVTGVINFHGEVIPVIDMRRRFNLSSREIELEDQLIIAQTSKRLVALMVDSITTIRECNQILVVSAEQAFPFADYLSGAAIMDDNLILITDLDKFLSLDEEKMLETAMLEMTNES